MSKDQLAIENMELKAQLHEIKTALGITQNCGSESTPLQRIAAFNRMREIVRDALGIYGEYFVSNEADSMLRAIANLKHSLQLSQNEVKELQSPDRDELQSERDYYRGILDKLCDRGNFDSIEALEQFTDAGMYEPRTELRQKLAESQAKTLKYMCRIVELEREVRSLREPVPTTAVFLSTSELIQIIRSLLK